MPNLREWLLQKNLGQLEESLAENEIDLDVLFDLTDEDMREMGLSLGARKRLRAAIQTHEDDSPQNQVDGVRTAERRHLTTLFVDLADSTALSSQLDPEDMGDLIKAYQNTVAGIVTRYKGHIAKYMGDGVLCYFGWPEAHEDDAIRAARSALEITRTVATMRAPDGRPLAARTGAATGMVVVGDLIGEGSAQEESVVGDTPNLAARLQNAADPGQVIVSETTKQLVLQAFEFETMGMLNVKGFSDPVPAWRIVSKRSLESRFEEQDSAPMSPMIGRSHELGLIMERWQRTLSGEGQVVVLTGEAGIGKSRLTRAFTDEIRQQDHYRISYHCSPYHTDSSFHPVIRQLSHAMDFLETDTADQKLEKLRRQLRAADPQIIAELLQVSTHEPGDIPGLTPQQLRVRIMQETSAEVRALSEEKPVIVVVEDAHWSDASTLAMIEACLNQIADARVMMLITARPSFAYGFRGHPIVSRLALNRLGSNQTADILAKITGGKQLPDELVTEIINRTDGIPLFIEELTKTIVESRDLVETETSFELAGPLSRVSIPATLHDSLMARIDRLQPVKEIAQIAACIGREFRRPALAKIARVDDQTLDHALEQLARSELVFRRGAPPDVSYVFKHALVRDVAYDSLLKRRRTEIHHRLTTLFEDDPNVPPELVAHHATQAGLTEKAVLLWREAAKNAEARPAYVEATNHLRTALKMVTLLLDNSEWRETELALLVQLAQVHIAKDGYASREASETFSQALDRVEATSDPELKIAIYYGTWIGPYIGNDMHRAYELVTRLLQDMADAPGPIPLLISHRMRAATLIAMGRPSDALTDLRTAYELYQTAELTDFSTKFAQDPGVQIWCYMLLAQWLTGDEDEAWNVAEKAIERARELGHANTLCYAMLHVATLSIWAGDINRARSLNDEMRAVAQDHEMTLWQDFVMIHDAIFACMSDEPGAVAALDAALEHYRNKGCRLWFTLYLSEQAKTILRTGDPRAAQDVISLAFREQVETGEHWAEAELYRIEGEIKAALKDLDGAAKAIDNGILVARAQKAPILEARLQTTRKQLNI